MSEPTFTTKLGKTRAGERSRIWIEGKRLVAHGFVPGSTFTAHWRAATLQLTVGGEPKGERAVTDTVEVRRVSGKGDKPIIDIVGSRVFDLFGTRGATVRVSYAQGVITIRAEVQA